MWIDLFGRQPVIILYRLYVWGTQLVIDQTAIKPNRFCLLKLKKIVLVRRLIAAVFSTNGFSIVRIGSCAR